MLSDANGDGIGVRGGEGMVYLEIQRGTVPLRADETAEFCEQLLRTADWVLANDPGGAA